MTTLRALATAMVAVVLAVGCDGTTAGGNPDTNSDGATPSDMAGHSPADLTPPAAKADLAPQCEGMKIPEADCSRNGGGFYPSEFKPIVIAPQGQSELACFVQVIDKNEGEGWFAFLSSYASMTGDFEGTDYVGARFKCIRH